MLYRAPKHLKKGDRVAIIAPSSPISSMKSLYDSFPIFEKHDLEPVVGDNIKSLRSTKWSSAPLQDRIDEITWAFEDDSISAVVAAEGGYSAIELLPYLPYDVIGETRKLFMGMSDVTAIGNAILAGSKLINFHGPNARIRQDKPDDAKSLDEALKLITSDGAWLKKPWSKMTSPPRCVCGGIVKGKAVGGNLTLFASLLGTPFIPDVSEAILFFEDVYAGGYEVSLALNRLELAGVLNKASGIVFGEFTKQPKSDDQDMSVEDIIVEKFRYRMPCLWGLNFSHGETVATVPLGVETVLNADGCSVSFGDPFEDQ